MYTVFLALGSNLGDRFGHLTKAIEEIRRIATIQALSSIYETEPVGAESGGEFLNMAIAIQTPDDPPLLIVKLKQIERKIGRKHPSHGLPRIIDIDILMYRGLVYEDHTVRVPHPALPFRRFALEPLHEIAPTAVHPALEKTIATLSRNCLDKHTVIRSDQQLHFTTSYS